MAGQSLIVTLLGLTGTPESGGKLFSYVRSTTTPRPLYTDIGLTTPATNPVVADVLGSIVSYFDTALQYSISAKTADESVTLWSADIVGGVIALTYVNPNYQVNPIIEASWLPILGTPAGAGWQAVLGNNQDKSGPTSYARFSTLQALINYCAPLEKTAFISAADYTATGLTHTTGSLKLQGEDAGTQGTRIATTTNATLFNITAQATIEGIGFIGSTEVLKTAQIGLRLDNVNNVHLRHLIFDGFYTSILLNETVFYTSLDGVKFFSSTGPTIVGQGSSGPGYAIQMRGVEVIPSSVGGSIFDFTNLGSINSMGTISSPANATDHTLFIRTTATLAGVQQFANDVFEGSVKSAIRIDGTSLKSVNYVFFDNCYANQSGTGEPTLLLKYVNALHWVGGYISGTGAGIKFDGGTCMDIHIGPVRFELNSSIAAILAASGSVIRNLRVNGATLDGGTQRFMDLSAATTVEDIYIGPDTKFGAHASPVLMPTGQYDKLNWRHENKFFAHKNSTDQTGVASNTDTKVTFGTEVYDVRSRFASSTWSPYTGVQRLRAQAYVTGVTAGGQVTLRLYKNGAFYLSGPIFLGSSSNDALVSGDWEFLSEPGDTFDVYVRGASGATLTVNGDTKFTMIAGHQV